jgi:hypothetical protein
MTIVLGCLATLLGSFGSKAASAAPYQAAAHAQCPDAINCAVSFPQVPAGSRFDVQFAACEIASAGPGTHSGRVAFTRFYLQTRQGGKTVPLALASIAPDAQFDGTSTHSAVSQAVDFFVPAGETLQIFAWPEHSENSAFIDRMDCTVVGEMKDASTPGPYVATAHALCADGINCAVAFPKVPAGSRFDVRFAACEIASASLASVGSTRFYMQTKQGRKAVPLPLASIGGAQFDGESVHSALSQPVEFSVAGGEKLQIFAWPYVNTFIDWMDCTVAGEMKDATTPGPYVATAHAQCPDEINCAVAFPKVPAGSRFDVQFAACEIASASGAYVRNTRFYLQAKQGGKTVPLALASLAPGFQYDGANFRSAVSQPVDFFVPAGETLQILPGRLKARIASSTGWTARSLAR